MARNPEPKHQHNYQVTNQKTYEDKKKGGHPFYVTYTFLKCVAPGKCDKGNIMHISRWKEKRKR